MLRPRLAPLLFVTALWAPTTVQAQRNYEADDKMGNFELRLPGGLFAEDRLGNFVRTIEFAPTAGPATGTLMLGVWSKAGKLTDRQSIAAGTLQPGKRYPLGLWLDEWNPLMPSRWSVVSHGAWSSAAEAWRDRRCGTATHLVQMQMSFSAGGNATHFVCVKSQ